MTVPIKLLTVDDHAGIGTVLRTVFERSEHFSFLGHAHSGDTAIRMVKLMQPHLVLMDLHMRPMNGIETTKRLRSLFPSLQIVGFSDAPYKYEERQMVDAGALAVISKNLSPQNILAALLEMQVPV